MPACHQVITQNTLNKHLTQSHHPLNSSKLLQCLRAPSTMRARPISAVLLLLLSNLVFASHPDAFFRRLSGLLPKSFATNRSAPSLSSIAAVITVSLRYPGNPRLCSTCDAVLIDHRWALVPASCISALNGRVVIDVRNTLAADIPIEAVFLHDSELFALLRLSNNAPQTTVKITRAPSRGATLSVISASTTTPVTVQSTVWCSKRSSKPFPASTHLCATSEVSNLARCPVKSRSLVFDTRISRKPSLVALGISSDCIPPHRISWYFRLGTHIRDIKDVMKRGKSTKFERYSK